MEKTTNPTTPTVIASRNDATAGAKKPLGGPPPPGLPNVAVLLRRVIAHWPIAIVVILIGAGVSFKVAKAKQPSFRSECTVVYRGGVTGDPSPEMLKTLAAKLKETVLAQTTLKRVVFDLKLYPDMVKNAGAGAVVEMIKPKVEFKPKAPDTFTIAYEGPSRDEAQQVTQRLAEVLAEESAKLRRERARDSIEFLESEKKRVDEELEQIEKDVTLFMADHPEFASDKQGGLGTSIRAGQKAEAADRKKSSASAARIRRATGLPDKGNPLGPSPAASAPAVDPVLISARNAARNELLSARKELAEKSLRFTDQHPDVRAASARVAAAEFALEQAEAAIAAAQPPPTAEVPVASVPDPFPDPIIRPNGEMAIAPPPSASAAKPKAMRVPSNEEHLVNVEREWARLNRDLTQTRQRQASIEQKLSSAQINASAEESGYAAQIVVLDPAYRPVKPTGKPPSLLFFMGMGISLALGLALSAAWGLFLDDRLFDASEIEGIGLVPLLGSVPKPKGRERKLRWLKLRRARG